MSSVNPIVFEPDVLFAEGRLQRGGTLVVDEHGKVSATVSPGAERVRLPGTVLLPGLVNAHSHAFQRVIRGRTEYLASAGASDDFWSWRERMYQAATSLTPEGIYAASRQTFLEMALGGITSVGEFHYLHHQPDGSPYADPLLLSKTVIQAARDVGLRIALLRVLYSRAGFQLAPIPRQQRFYEDVSTFLERTEWLATQQKDECVTVGYAPHSVRAVPKDALSALARHGGARVVHFHVAEQPAEVTACLTEHSRRPVELLADAGLLSERATAVHAIHLSEEEISLLATSGTSVCACPSTERNLGDGVVPADLLARAKVHLSLGSDSHATIDLLDDARQLEGHLRLLRQKRAVMDLEGGRVDALGQRLFDAATVGGARSLGLNVGTLAVGQPADFFTVDLSHPSVLGAPLEALLPSLVFGADKAAVRDVAVQGSFIVRDGRHPASAEISSAFVKLMHLLTHP